MAQIVSSIYISNIRQHSSLQGEAGEERSQGMITELSDSHSLLVVLCSVCVYQIAGNKCHSGFKSHCSHILEWKEEGTDWHISLWGHDI